MPVANLALSLFYHTYKLEKTHHLIVVGCGCMNEFASGLVNLAKLLKDVVQMFVGHHWPFFPTVIDDILAKSWQVHCELSAMDTR